MAVRFLRPRYIVPVHTSSGAARDAVWLVDESRPVAAVLNADGQPELLTWDPPDVPRGGRSVIAGGSGIVVQDGSALAWVRRAGSSVQLVDGLVLAAAVGDVAWLIDRTAVDPGRPGPDGEPPVPPAAPPGRIVMAHRDGHRSEIGTPRPVWGIEVDGEDVIVELVGTPVSQRSSHGSWGHSYPTSRVRIAVADLLRTGLRGGVPVDTPRRPVRGGADGWSWSWLETDPQLIRRASIHAAGLLWTAGTPPPQTEKIDRHAVVVGRDRQSLDQIVHVDLGLGIIGCVQAVVDEVWLTVARRRYLAVPHDKGVDVIAVAASGTVRTIHPANSLDISFTAPPLIVLPPDQARAHVAEVRSRFADLDTYWHGGDGSVHALSHGLADPAVDVVGQWPDTRLVITMTHTKRPGLRLRRTLALFDERGRPIENEYAEIHLMEDLDTRYIAPADEAVDGVLDT